MSPSSAIACESVPRAIGTPRSTHCLKKPGRSRTPRRAPCRSPGNGKCALRKPPTCGLQILRVVAPPVVLRENTWGESRRPQHVSDALDSLQPHRDPVPIKSPLGCPEPELLADSQHGSGQAAEEGLSTTPLPENQVASSSGAGPFPILFLLALYRADEGGPGTGLPYPVSHPCPAP